MSYVAYVERGNDADLRVIAGNLPYTIRHSAGETSETKPAVPVTRPRDPEPVVLAARAALTTVAVSGQIRTFDEVDPI